MASERVLLARIRDLLVAALHGLNRVLPLLDELLPLVVQLPELVGGLVKLDLLGLRLGGLVLDLSLVLLQRLGQLLDLERQLLDLTLVRAPVALERHGVLLLLLSGHGPLLHLILVPIHLQLEAVHLFVALEQERLDGAELALEVVAFGVQLAHLLLHAPDLALGQLLHVLLARHLLELAVVQLLRVQQLLLDVLQVLRHDLHARRALRDLALDRLELLLLGADLIVQCLVLVVREQRQVVDARRQRPHIVALARAVVSSVVSLVVRIVLVHLVAALLAVRPLPAVRRLLALLWAVIVVVGGVLAFARLRAARPASASAFRPTG